MRRLPPIAGLLLLTLQLFGQSPHGPSLKLDCADCHSPEGWAIAAEKWQRQERHQPTHPDSIAAHLPKFDHSRQTQFPLEGQHQEVNCRDCHPRLLFTEAKPDCYSCHTDVHQQSVGTDCARCHTAVNWQVNQIAEIHQAVGFPLIGVHGVVACNQCHAADNPLRIDRRNTDCVHCHQQEFQQTRQPNHVQLGLDTECGACHSIHGSGWRPASFTAEHNKFYVLDGAHAAISNDCAACHVNNNYSHTPNTCFGCHEPDYTRTLSPNHAKSQFSTDCATCHTTGAWIPAAFDHDKFYPLKGAHKKIEKECAECHIGGNYDNTPNTCVGCHIADYNKTKDPNHITAQFPTSCEDCHSENAWEPATFNHDAQHFPIYSGHHRGVWSSCTECHTTPGNYAVFSCIDCHEHSNQNDLAQEHRRVRNYQYVSTACYSCHPRGS
ncbi:MAG: hypothetical protein ACKOAY_01165 [Haliscomenobacter sp.]